MIESRPSKTDSSKVPPVMNTADYVILGIVGISLTLSLKRGFITEAFSLAIWVAAFVIAKLFCNPLALLLAPYINPPSFRIPVGFVVLFIATLVVGGLVQRLLKELVNVTGLTATDRMLGMVFGAARGVLIVVTCLGMLSRMTDMPKDPWWKQSMLIPQLMVFETWSTQTGKLAWKRIMQMTS